MFVPTVEKYRPDFKRSNRVRFDDDAPKGEKMRVGKHRKIYADYANVCRWLNNQIGREWNAVYSEICAATAPNTLERLHIVKAVENVVDLHITVIDGEVYAHGVFRQHKLTPGNLYVKNGVLCRIPFKKYVKPSINLRVEFIGQNDAIGVSGGQWFAVTFTEYTPNLDYYGRDRGRYDVFLKEKIGEFDAVKAYGKKVIATAKRALSKKEIKRYKATR